MLQADPDQLYKDIQFGDPREDRPYTFINMVATIDGKIESGERGEDVVDLGSKADHQILRTLESKADAVLVGANFLRASPDWQPKTPIRVAVTRSGNIPLDGPFLTGGRGILAVPAGVSISGVFEVIEVGGYSPGQSSVGAGGEQHVLDAPSVALRHLPLAGANLTENEDPRYSPGGGVGRSPVGEVIAMSQEQDALDTPSVSQKTDTSPKGTKFQNVDLTALLKILRHKYGVKRLLILGGSEINAQMLRHDLVDELFLTIAPKIKLGRDVPTYADGVPLRREDLMVFGLISVNQIESEVFLRYRRANS